MISKNEFEYTKVRIRKIEDALFDFENKDPLYLKYEVVERMSPDDKNKLQQEWNDYYKDVEKTPIWKAFQLSRQAMKRGQIGIVKEIAKRAENYKSTLKKPRLEDPEFLGYKMSNYHVAKTTLERLKNLYEEHLTIYGKKSEKESSL